MDCFRLVIGKHANEVRVWVLPKLVTVFLQFTGYQHGNYYH